MFETKRKDLRPWFMFNIYIRTFFERSISKAEATVFCIKMEMLPVQDSHYKIYCKLHRKYSKEYPVIL